MGNTLDNLKEVLTYIGVNDKSSSFYKDLWNMDSPDIENIDDLRGIPILTSHELSNVTFPERDFATAQVFLKLVSKHSTPFLIGKTIQNIADESLVIAGERPLILFEKMEEIIEWGLFCYEQNILPLAAELNDKLTAIAAGLYGIDSIICDTRSLNAYSDLLIAHCDIDKILEIHVLDSSFEFSLEKKFPRSSFAYNFTIPECGIIAQANNPNGAWKSADTVVLESLNQTLIVSSLHKLPTPLVRYDTTISIQPVNVDNDWLLTEFSLIKEHER